MSAPRTVTVRTQDHGRITIPEPSWCTGRHPVEGYREDVEHQGSEVPLHIPTRHGERRLLTAYLSQRPFSGLPATEIVFGGVEVFGFDADGLRDVIDSLLIYALGRLQSFARQLEQIEREES